MEFSSAIKRNEVLIHATAWMNLRNMLSARSHKNSQSIGLHLREISRIGKSRDTESRLVVLRAGGEDGSWISFGGRGGDENASELDKGGAYAVL